MKNDAKDQETRPEPKPPIYSVAVIEVACRALEVLCDTDSRDEELKKAMNEAQTIAVHIIRDGLASHERAIKGET